MLPRGHAGLLLAVLSLALASLPQPSTASYRLDGQGAAAAGVGPPVGQGAATTPAGIAAFPTLWQYYDSLFPAEALNPTVETLRGHEVVSQVPDNPRATLFIAHGCSHAAHDWWPPSAACKQCLGLPEEVAQTQQALARGYAVLAMTSNNPTGCMDWTGNHKDAVQIIKSFRKKHNLEDLPLYGLGVSVGGGFVLKLPQYLKMDGLLSEVLGPRPEGWDPWTYDYEVPPTVFVSMDQDPFMAAKISKDSATLRSLGVRTATVRVAQRPVYPTFFSDRSPRVSPETSIRAVAALHQIGMLDEKGMVTVDPRHTHKPWVKELIELVPELASGMTEDHSHVWEEMNLAYSAHEIIADFATAAFVWFEGGGKADFADLVRQHAPAGSGVVADAATAIPPPPAPLPTQAGEANSDAAAAAAALAQAHKGEQQRKQSAVAEGAPQATSLEEIKEGQQMQPQQVGEEPAGSGTKQAPQQQQADGKQVLELPAEGQRPGQEQQQQQQQRQQVRQQSQVSTQPEEEESLEGAAPQAQAPAPGPSPAQALHPPPHNKPPTETAIASSGEGGRSAAAVVGGVAGTLAGAALLLVLYRIAERKRAGFAALPTTAPHQHWEGSLPPSHKLPSIPEEADP